MLWYFLDLIKKTKKELWFLEKDTCTLKWAIQHVIDANTTLNDYNLTGSLTSMKIYTYLNRYIVIITRSHESFISICLFCGYRNDQKLQIFWIWRDVKNKKISLRNKTSHNKQNNHTFEWLPNNTYLLKKSLFEKKYQWEGRVRNRKRPRRLSRTSWLGDDIDIQQLISQSR